MRRVLLGVATMVVLAAPGAAWGGGFSTIGLRELPGGVRAGTAWTAELTVLGHGRTPLRGMRPVVRITRPDGSGGRTFGAVETRRPGVYRARVTFPAAGGWALAISEWPGGGAHTFGIVRVGGAGERAGGGTATPRAAAGSDGVDGWQRVLLAGGAGMVAAAAAGLLGRRRATPSAGGRPAVGA